MTTSAHHLHGPLLAEVRAAPAGRRRVRVSGGARPRLLWWHGRLVLGATIGGGMAGALLGVVQGFVAVGLLPVRLLEAYGAGAGFGASLGLVAGLGLSLVMGVADRCAGAQVVPARRVWMRYRR